jgi:hypothetical protein
MIYNNLPIISTSIKAHVDIDADIFSVFPIAKDIAGQIWFRILCLRGKNYKENEYK